MSPTGPSSAMELEALIIELMNPVNDSRIRAEGIYNAWKQNIEPLLFALVQVLRTSEKEDVRGMCIILLRGLLTKNTLWDTISPATKQNVLSSFLISLETEASPLIRHKLSIMIAEIAGPLTSKKQWPELFPFLQKCFDSGVEFKKESALTIFGELAFSLGKDFEPFYAKLRDVLSAGLCDPSLNVRIAALLGTCNFLQSLFKPEARQMFLPLAPLVIETIKAILTANRESEAQSALQLLVQIADVEPLFLKHCVDPLVDTMLLIAKTPALEEKTRYLAGEVLLTLAESRPAMMRKITRFVPAIVELAFTLMLSLEDTPLDEWNKTSDDDNDEMEAYDHGEEYLNRLAMTLGGRVVVPVLFPIAIGFLKNQQDWKQRYCSVMAISIIGEGCKKTLLPHLADLLNSVVPMLHDPHPKVRWATCNCIGQMCTDFGPTIQDKFHQQLVPALASVMDDVANPRTMSHAAAALINFCDLCTPEILNLYIDPLLNKLYSLLQTGNVIVQQQALTAIAAIANTSGSHFTKYYDVLMPNLLQIIVYCKTKEQSSLRGKAIECISLVGVAVGKEKFNGAQVMDILMKEQALITAADDQSQSLIHEAMARICHCLGKDFVPYLSYVMPPLLQTAEHSDITITETVPDEQPSKDGWEFVVIGTRCVGVRTASLEEKAEACDMITTYCEELGGHFFSYIDPVLKLMLPLLKFYYQEDIRATAAQCMAALLNSASEHMKTVGGASGADAMYVRNLFLHIFPTYVEAIEQELDTYVLTKMLESFVKCLDTVGQPIFNKEQLDIIVNCLTGVLKEYIDFIKSQNEQKGDADADEEEVERINDEISNYEDAIGSVADIIGRLVKYHNEPFLASVKPVADIALEFIKPTSRIAERHISLCMLDDIVEFGGKEATVIIPQVIPFYLNYLKDPDPALRQAAGYGIGIFAKKGQDTFVPFVTDSLVRLNEAVTTPNARSEEFEMATENIISSIAWICVTFGNMIDLSHILPIWLHFLPVIEDEEEAVVIYNNLCHFVETSGSKILGANYEHLPKAVAIFISILGTNYVDESLTHRITAIVRSLQQLPQEILQKSWVSLSPELQAKLHSILNGQQ